jgi:hypothetical protein
MTIARGSGLWIPGAEDGNERASVVIYGHAPLVSAAFPRDATGIFLARERNAMADIGSRMWVPAVTRYFLCRCRSPFHFSGRMINHRLRGDPFLKYVHGGLVCVGVVLLIQAIRQK